jgi:hypothetical protein
MKSLVQPVLIVIVASLAITGLFGFGLSFVVNQSLQQTGDKFDILFTGSPSN